MKAVDDDRFHVIIRVFPIKSAHKIFDLYPTVRRKPESWAKSHYFIADVKRFIEGSPAVIFCYVPIILRFRRHRHLEFKPLSLRAYGPSFAGGALKRALTSQERVGPIWLPGDNPTTQSSK